MAFTAPFLAWLAKPAHRCLLARVAVKTGGAETTRYLSSATRTPSEPGDTPANQAYTARISGGLQFSRRLALDGSGGSIAFGDMELDNTDGKLDGWLTDVWAKRAVSFYLGDVSWPTDNYELVFSGTVEDIVPKDYNRLSLVLRDIFGPLDSTLSTATVGGAADNKDVLRPISLGECFNVSPVLLDAATQKYGYHLNSATEGVLETRDNGLVVDTTITATSGHFVLTSARFGLITSDVQGAKIGGAYRNDAGGLVEWVATTIGDGNFIVAGQIDSTALTAFRAACAQPVGLYIVGQSNRLVVMRALAAAVGATVTTTYDGKMILVRVGFGVSVGNIGTKQIVKDSFKLLSRPIIKGAILLNAERNWTPQPSGLAASVTSSQWPILGDQFVTLGATDATVLADYAQSVTPPADETLMVVAADVSAEATRRLALWSVPRTVFGFEGFPECFQYEIGNTVTLTYPRFGLSAGVPAQIIGMLHDWAAQPPRVHLEVLV